VNWNGGFLSRSRLINSPERQVEVPQGLKPSSLLAPDGTTERRALPEPFMRWFPGKRTRSHAAYNIFVVPAQRQPDSRSDDPSQDNPPHKHQRYAIYAEETCGLLLMAFLLLVLTLIRYWHAIHWSVR
jgi:hypothetical protein